MAFHFFDRQYLLHKNVAKQSVSKKKLTVPLPWQRKGGSKTFFWNDLTLTLLVVRRPSMSDTFTLHYIYTLKPHTRAYLLYVYQTRLVRDRLNSRPHAYLGLRPRKLRNASYYHRPCHDIVSSRFLLFPSASLPFPSLLFPSLPYPLPRPLFTFSLPFISPFSSLFRFLSATLFRTLQRSGLLSDRIFQFARLRIVRVFPFVSSLPFVDISINQSCFSSSFLFSFPHRIHACDYTEFSPFPPAEEHFYLFFNDLNRFTVTTTSLSCQRETTES